MDNQHRDHIHISVDSGETWNPHLFYGGALSFPSSRSVPLATLFPQLWFKAVESYGTPHSFFEGVKLHFGNFSSGGMEYPMSWADSFASYTSKRRELMRSESPYVASSNACASGLHVKPTECQLCQNVLQGIVSADPANSPGGSIIFDLDKFLLLPNRYPLWSLASLVVPKNHNRVEDRTLTAEYLSAVMTVADELDLVAARNHPRDAMSIPNHEHFHLHPKSLHLFDHLSVMLEEVAASGRNFAIPISTPFSTLVVRRSSIEKVIEDSLPILQGMEAQGEVFTLGYYKQNLLISPRKDVGLKGIQVGFRVLFHNFDPTDRNFKNIENHVPLKGEYDWSRFL